MRFQVNLVNRVAWHLGKAAALLSASAYDPQDCGVGAASNRAVRVVWSGLLRLSRATIVCPHTRVLRCRCGLRCPASPFSVSIFPSPEWRSTSFWRSSATLEHTAFIFFSAMCCIQRGLWMLMPVQIEVNQPPSYVILYFPIPRCNFCTIFSVHIVCVSFSSIVYSYISSSKN